MVTARISIGFVLFAVGCAWCAWRVLPVKGSVASRRETVTERSGVPLSWIALAALGSVMLLAVTNHLCLEVAAAPLPGPCPWVSTCCPTFSSSRAIASITADCRACCSSRDVPTAGEPIVWTDDLGSLFQVLP
jgi:hypothetical protein